MKLQPSKAPVPTLHADPADLADTGRPPRPDQAPSVVGDVATQVGILPLSPGKARRQAPPVPAGPVSRKPVTVPRYH